MTDFEALAARLLVIDRELATNWHNIEEGRTATEACADVLPAALDDRDRLRGALEQIAGHAISTIPVSMQMNRMALAALKEPDHAD